MRIAPLLLLSLLSACACENQGIAVHQWTVGEQIEIAKERAALPPDSILRGVLQEWEDTRQALK